MLNLRKGASAASLAAVLGTAVSLTSLTGDGSAPLTQSRPAVAAATPLSDDLDRLLADPRLKDSQVGVMVRDARDNTVLYDKDASNRLLPASNTKLLTSAAALEILGPDHRFATTVLASGPRSGAVLRGDLHLRGTGDPTMLGADYDALAGAVAAAGLRRVTGRLVADDTYFDHERLGPFWSWDDEPYYYSGQTSALSIAPDTDYDTGSVIVRISPGARPGAKARVSTEPPTSYVRIRNEATTGAAGSSDSADAVREHGTNTIVVSGSIPADGTTDEVWATVWEPTGLAASVFRDALARHGVRVLGSVATRATPAGAVEVARHESMPLSQLLVPFLKLSNNMHAEVLVKAMGAKSSGDGSWSGGIAAAKAVMPGLGVDPAAIRWVDGSGLSRADQIAPGQISSLLVTARGEPWFPAWYASLPIAAQPDRFVGGTLRSRMVGTAAAGNVHAKTGSMTGVSGLSGYVTDATGRPLVFSVVSNNFLAGSSGIRSIEDAVAVRLATEGSASARGLRPAPAAPEDPAASRRQDLECSWLKAC